MTREQLSTLRQRYQLTQRALADLLGTTESTIGRLERGHVPIDTRWSSHLQLLFECLARRRVAV